MMGYGGTSSDQAAVWAAAGTAYAHAASAMHCAVMDACRHAWTAKVDAGRAMGDAAASHGRVVGADNTVNGRAVGETATAMRRTVDAIERSAVEFGQAARLSTATADAWEHAGEALGRAGLDDRARAVRGLSDEARDMARTLGGMADMSRERAALLGQNAAEWVRDTSDWEDGCELVGKRDAWMASGDALQAAATEERVRSDEMLQSTERVVREAAGDLEKVAAEAGRFADAVNGRLDGADVQEAAAAWREGREAAAKAVRDWRLLTAARRPAC